MMDAFGHLKAIGANAAAKPLLDKGGVEPGDGIVGVDAGFVQAAVHRFYARGPNLRLLA